MGLEPRSLSEFVGSNQHLDPTSNFLLHKREHEYRSIVSANVACPLTEVGVPVLGTGLDHTPEYMAISEVTAALTPEGGCCAGDLMHRLGIQIERHHELGAFLASFAERRGVLGGGVIRRGNRTVAVYYLYKAFANETYFEKLAPTTYVNEFGESVPVVSLHPRETHGFLNHCSLLTLRAYREENADAIARKWQCPHGLDDSRRNHVVQEQIETFGIPTMVDPLLVRQAILCKFIRQLLTTGTKLNLSLGLDQVAKLDQHIWVKTDSYNAHANPPEVAYLERDIMRLITFGVAKVLAEESGVGNSIHLAKTATSIDYLAHLEEQLDHMTPYVRERCFVGSEKRFRKLLSYTHDLLMKIEAGAVNHETASPIIDSLQTFGEPYGWLAAALATTPITSTAGNFETVEPLQAIINYQFEKLHRELGRVLNTIETVSNTDLEWWVEESVAPEIKIIAATVQRTGRHRGLEGMRKAAGLSRGKLYSRLERLSNAGAINWSSHSRGYRKRNYPEPNELTKILYKRLMQVRPKGETVLWTWIWDLKERTNA